MAGKIKNRLNHDLLCVYTDYEGDFTKPYRYIVGCEVKNLSEIPPGYFGKEISPSSYALFTAEGEFPQSMLKAWNAIWSSKVDRAYTADFEVYAADFNPQNNPEVKIYIATKVTA